MDLNQVRLNPATFDDVKELRDLINLAYRGERGWTRETDIISGARIDEAQLNALLEDSSHSLLICRVDDVLLASVCVETKPQDAYIGMFSVHPDCQGQGIGDRVLALAEEHALQNGNVSRLLMLVVSGRDELVAYYERRGYRKTGVFKPYPVGENVGIPKVSGMQIEVMEKFPIHHKC